MCCVPTTHSQISFHHHILASLYPLPLPHFLPSGHHHTVVCLYLRVSVLYPTYEWNHMVLSFFWLTYFTYHNILKVHPSMLSQMAVFHLFFWLSSILMYLCTKSSLLSPPWKDTFVVSMSWPLWIMLQWTRGLHLFANKWFQFWGVDTQKRDYWVIW